MPHLFAAWTSCDAVLQSGISKSGVYLITPERYPATAFPVYCELRNNQGWTIIQRRTDGSTDFERSWEDYKTGFGPLSGDMWLGLDRISRLTANDKTKLLITMRPKRAPYQTVFAEYQNFNLGNEETNYTLHLEGYSKYSTAGDSLIPTEAYQFHNLDGMQFSTFDRDNDVSENGHCAFKYKSGWWHNRCFLANLNGLFLVPGRDPPCHDFDITPRYMSWYSIDQCYGNIIASEMKVCPVPLK